MLRIRGLLLLAAMLCLSHTLRADNGISVFFNNQAVWQQVCVYSWTNTPFQLPHGQWPGRQLNHIALGYHNVAVSEATFNQSPGINLIL